MKALWIRVEAHDVDAPDIAQFAEAIGVDEVTAVGYSTVLAGAIAEHTDDGTIAKLPDRQLEKWARWRGKKGVMGQAIRDHLQSPDGSFRNWPETMGQLVDRRAKDRDRKRLEKEERERRKHESGAGFRGRSTEFPRSVRGNSTVTERNGTRRYETLKAEGSERGPDETSASLRSGPTATATAPATAAPEAGTLPPTALEFVDRFYPLRGRRRTDVVRQLHQLAALEPVKTSAARHVQAYSVARLEAKCAEVIGENQVRDLDKAIVVLFAKLADTSDGSAPGLADAQALATDPDATAIETWIREHPHDVSQLRHDIAAEHPELPTDTTGDVLLDAYLRARIRERHFTADASEVSHGH